MKMSFVYGQPDGAPRPGIVLGPYEALIAMIAWLREALPQSRYSGNLQKLITSPKRKEQLLTGYMLYGAFDAHSAMPFFDTYLFSRGFRESRRELVGDFLLGAEDWSPFSHTLEQGLSWPLFQDTSQPNLEDLQKLTSSCFKALTRAGITGYTNWGEKTTSVSLREGLNRSINLIWECNRKGIWPVDLSQCSNTLQALVFAIQRSVDLDIPFLSRDMAAPRWVSKDCLTETTIVSIVFEEAVWLPRPQTFREAFALSQDERVVSFQNYIKDLYDRTIIGDLSCQAELREQVRKQIQCFKEKPWAGRLAKVITYAALPAEIAGMLCGSHLVGISVAGLGSVCEWISMMASSKKAKHWLSMSKLPRFEN